MPESGGYAWAPLPDVPRVPCRRCRGSTCERCEGTGAPLEGFAAAKVLRERRAATGVTAVEWARRTRYAKNTLQRWEGTVRGHRNGATLSPRVFARIWSALYDVNEAREP